MAVADRVRQVVRAANEVVQSEEFEQFLMNADDICVAAR